MYYKRTQSLLVRPLLIFFMTQIESAKPSIQIHNFSLKIFGCGGEHTIGTISNAIASYWQTEGEEFFEEYMFSWDKPEVVEEYKIPEKFQLQKKDWSELDDLAHLNGPEIINNDSSIEIIDHESNKKISEVIIKNEMIEIEEEPEVPEELITKVQCVYGQAWAKGNFTYGPIESNNPFDIKKLKINCAVWDGILILNNIEYDGENYFLEEEESTGKSNTIYFN